MDQNVETTLCCEIGGTKVCMWKLEVKWRNNDYGGRSESKTTTVINVSILKSHNKVIFRFNSVYIRRSVGLLEVGTEGTHSSVINKWENY